jgi:hypothetical protein
MRRKIASLLALAVAFSVAPVAAQAPAPSAERMAGEIVASAYAAADSKADAVAQFEVKFLEGFKRNPQGAALADKRPEVLQAGLNAGKAEFARQFDLVVVPAMSEAVAKIYATNFTPAELSAILAYHDSAAAKRFQASFAAGASSTEVSQARADDTVVSYRSSAVGLKETALSSQIADAMMSAMLTSLPKFMPQVNASVAAAFQSALAKPSAKR